MLFAITKIDLKVLIRSLVSPSQIRLKYGTEPKEAWSLTFFLFSLNLLKDIRHKATKVERQSSYKVYLFDLRKCFRVYSPDGFSLSEENP